MVVKAYSKNQLELRATSEDEESEDDGFFEPVTKEKNETTKEENAFLEVSFNFHTEVFLNLDSDFVNSFLCKKSDSDDSSSSDESESEDKKTKNDKHADSNNENYNEVAKQRVLEADKSDKIQDQRRYVRSF